MAKYNKIALDAVRHIKAGADPRSAWALSAADAYPDQSSAREKVCPRSTFLGLIDAGALVGIPAASELSKSINARYALEAIDALRSEPGLAERPSQLWERTSGAPKQQNGQLEVVLALWNAGLITDSPAR
ncbi:MAG: hypothetical protein IPH99_09335 [Xanthomonadales bacterium]|nr:hypothetical protein [Xanthomonadales bacterium]